MPWKEFESNDPESSGQKYYYNDQTGETVWDKPEGFIDTAEGASGDPPPPPELTGSNESEWELKKNPKGVEFYENKKDPSIKKRKEETKSKNGKTMKRVFNPATGDYDKPIVTEASNAPRKSAWKLKKRPSDGVEFYVNRKGRKFRKEERRVVDGKKMKRVFNPAIGKYDPPVEISSEEDDDEENEDEKEEEEEEEKEQEEKEEEKKLTEWIYLGRDTWADVNNPENRVTQKPAKYHKNKGKDGKVYYYDKLQQLAEGEEYDKLDELPDEEENVILEYNPSRIDTEKDLGRYYEKLQALSGTDPEKLSFPLPDIPPEDLKIYNIHYIDGLYKDPEVFKTKIAQLEESIRGLRPERPDVLATKIAIDHYNKVLLLLEKKHYIYFPHIEIKANGCFLIQDKPLNKKKNKQQEPEEEEEEGAPKKYSIAAYTKPTFTTSTIAEDNAAYEMSGDKFSANEVKYNKGNPELKFSYEIKFNSCIGECGIIQLQYLLIRNIMTVDDEKINTTEGVDAKTGAKIPKHKVDITSGNSILIINSGVDSKGDIISPSPDVLKYVSEFETAGVKINMFHDLLEEMGEEKAAPFNVMFENNYRRNVLEILYFYSDAKNVRIEDIKPFNADMPNMAENLFTTYNLLAMKDLDKYPVIERSKTNFITGGGNKPKKIQMFLDRLKRLYNQYVRRRNKRTKKRVQKKRTTRCNKKKGGNKKSKKN